MPYYDYYCRVCEEETTVKHQMNDKPTILCMKCNARMIRVYTAPAVSFKGNGWGHQ